MAELDGARQEIDQLRGVLRGHIWIGALLPAGDIDVPGLLARFSHRTLVSRSACARASPRTCSAQLAADEVDAAFCLLSRRVSPDFAVEQLSEDEVVAAFAPDRAPRSGRRHRRLTQHRIVAPSSRFGDHLRPGAEVLGGGAAAAAGAGERRSVLAALARCPGLRLRDPAPIADRLGRSGLVRSLRPPSPAGRPGLASGPERLTGRAHVHRVRRPGHGGTTPPHSMRRESPSRRDCAAPLRFSTGTTPTMVASASRPRIVLGICAVKA